MIRYTKGNRTRDIIGIIFLAIALTLLWVERATANGASEAFLSSDDAAQEFVLTITSPSHG